MTPGFGPTRKQKPYFPYPEKDRVIINSHNFTPGFLYPSLRDTLPVAGYYARLDTGSAVSDQFTADGSQDGTLTNGATRADDGGLAYSFDGTNDYIAFPLQSYVTSDFTLSAWVKTTSNNYQYAIAMEGAISPSGRWELLRVDIQANRVISGYLFNGGSVYIGGTTIASDTWAHVAFTRSGNLFKFFVNGSQTGSGTYTPTLIAASPSINDLGARRNSPTTLPLAGKIDDVLIYPIALDATNIGYLASQRGAIYA